jgi:Na+-driven multidrug efflux pump
MWVFRVAFAYVLSLDVVSLFGGLISFEGLGLGVMGVWVAMTIDWLFRLVMFLWRFLSGRWLTKYREIEPKKT